MANSDGVSPVRVESPDVGISRVVQEAEGGEWRVRWEFPSTTGQVTFILEYDVYGAVREVGESNEVFWRVVGEGWDVPLRQVEAEIVLPSALSVPGASLIPDPVEIATVEEVDGDVVARFRPRARMARRRSRIPSATTDHPPPFCRAISSVRSIRRSTSLRRCAGSLRLCHCWLLYLQPVAALFVGVMLTSSFTMEENAFHSFFWAASTSCPGLVMV